MMDKEHVKTDMIPLFTALAEDDQVQCYVRSVADPEGSTRPLPPRPRCPVSHMAPVIYL